MDEILRLIEELPSDDEKIALLEEIYSYGFEDGKNKINEQFAEAISQILKIRKANQYSEPTLIVGKRGNAVLLSEDDWNAIQETLFLNSIPGMTESIIEGANTLIEDCIPEDKVQW